MFTIEENKVFVLGQKLASPSFIVEAENLDLDILFETWFEEIEERVDFDSFYEEMDMEFTPSVFRELVVKYARNPI